MKRPDYGDATPEDVAPASKPTEKRKRGRPARPDPPVPYPRPPSPEALAKAPAPQAVQEVCLVKSVSPISKGPSFGTGRGADYFHQRDKDQLTKRMTRRLRELGFDVTLTPLANATP